LKEHIYSFYKKRFGKEVRSRARLAADCWKDGDRLTTEQKREDYIIFHYERSGVCLERYEDRNCPGPDGFPVVFYKKFWRTLKWWIMHMMEDFHKGELRLSKFNYGSIVLIPKLQEVATIK
jgi:hypothetical protein